MARVYQFSDDQEADPNGESPAVPKGATAATISSLHGMIDDWEGLAVAIIYHRSTK